MHEDIVAFPKTTAEEPFILEMCGVSYCDGTYHIRRKCSSLWCMEYVIRGEGCVTVDDETFHPVAGDVYILPARHAHDYYSDDKNPWEKIWFNIRGDMIEPLVESYGLGHVYHLKGADVYSLFKQFVETARQADDASEAFKETFLCFIRIVQVLSAYVTRKCPEGLAASLKKHIDETSNYELSLDDLSKEFFCTKAHLVRVYKKAYGITPYDALLKRKITVAKMLLDNTGMTVGEIAEYLGFRDYHYFSNFFKQHTDFSPISYRKRNGR